MDRRRCRITLLNGVLMIVFGIFIAGFGLTWLVARDVYGQSVPVDVPGDYRAWIMAHLQGLLNGLVVIALALVTRIYDDMHASTQKWLMIALITMGWGNVIASFLSPLLGVRGMAFDAHLVNNVVTGIYTIAFIATVAAVFGVSMHLWRDRT